MYKSSGEQASMVPTIMELEWHRALERKPEQLGTSDLSSANAVVSDTNTNIYLWLCVGLVKQIYK